MKNKIFSIINILLLMWTSFQVSHALERTQRASISDLTDVPINGSWAPNELYLLDYFVKDSPNSSWWTWVGTAFNQYNWQHAGLYSGSDPYGSKFIIHALGGDFTVQETPASIFLKYGVDKLIWAHKENISFNKRETALDVVRNTINKVSYPSSAELLLDPDAIDLTNIKNSDELYCSQLVHVTYDQLLDSDVAGWNIRPISPIDLVDALDKEEITNLYAPSNSFSFLPEIWLNSPDTGGATNKDDEDWWKITFFQPNTTYTLETSKYRSSTIDTVLYLYRVCASCTTNYFTQVDIDDDGGENGYSKIEFTTPNIMNENHSYFVMARGYQSSTGSYELTITSDSDNENNSLSYIDGAGSIIRADTECWGCNKDEADMQTHFSSSSTVVFQWLSSSSCPYLDIGVLSSNEYRDQHPNQWINPNTPLDVKIHVKKWNSKNVQTAYKTTLPVTVEKVDSWNTIAVTSQQPLSEVKQIIAQCSMSPITSSGKTQLNETTVNLESNYAWAGNSSIIRRSNPDYERQDGIYQDVAIGLSDNKAITLFQWQPSSNCLSLNLKSGQYPSNDGISTIVDSVDIKFWANKDWNTNKCSQKLPCTIDAPNGANGYYVIRVKTDANVLDGNRISAVCQN